MNTISFKIFVPAILFFSLFFFTNLVSASYKEGQREISRGNFKSAFNKFLQGASEGDSKAQNALGELYLNGKGTSKNPKKALIWFKFAANGGSKKAFKNLSFMYANGIGVDKNPLESSKWFKKYQDAESTTRQETLAIDSAKRNLKRKTIKVQNTQKNRIQNLLDTYNKLALNDARIYGQKMLKASIDCEALILKSEKGSWGSKNWASKCYDSFWNIADVSKDGKLSKAEITRAYRLTIKWLLLEISEKKLLGEKGIPKSIMPSIDAILQVFMPLATELVFLNYDFNGNRSLDKPEATYDFKPKEQILYARNMIKLIIDYKSLTPSELGPLMKEFQELQKFFEMLEKLK